VQTNIVEQLDGVRERIDQLQHCQSQSAAELDALLPAVLDRAFKGEL
jgi:type I restriction enzyme S subunit